MADEDERGAPADDRWRRAPADLLRVASCPGVPALVHQRDREGSVEMTETEVRRRITGLDEDTQKRTVCALVGHSRIVTHGGFGTFHCARCMARVGDAIAGAFTGAGKVVVEHADCATCADAREALTWKDTLLAPDLDAAPEAAG